MDLSLAWPVTLFNRQFSKPAPAGSFKDSCRCGSNAVGSVNMYKTSFFTHFYQDILQLVLPHGCITKPDLIFWRVLKKELALWFFGFWQRASYRVSRFAKYVSRPASGQRWFLGHAIFADWLSSSLSLTPPEWFFVALSFETKYFSPLVVVLSWRSR